MVSESRMESTSKNLRNFSYRVEGIKKFQVTQENVTDLVIKIMKEKKFNNSSPKFLSDTIHNYANKKYEKVI